MPRFRPRSPEREGSHPRGAGSALSTRAGQVVLGRNNMLVGADLRSRIRLVCSGKASNVCAHCAHHVHACSASSTSNPNPNPNQVLSGFSIVRNLALGADVCNSARGMMFALGCVQALKCNTNKCPTGVTSQDPGLSQPSKLSSECQSFSQPDLNFIDNPNSYLNEQS